MNAPFALGARNEMPPLSFLWLELTNKCNLECLHCYAGSSPYVRDEAPLSETEYLAILDEAATRGCREVQFIGGEPTLNPLLPQLVRQAKALGFTKIEVFTNLLLLSSDLLANFIENGVCVATSVYSDRQDVHDAITTRRGSWARTIGNIKTILAANLELRVGIVVMDQNRVGVDRTRQWLGSLGVVSVGTDHMRGFGRARAVFDRHESF